LSQVVNAMTFGNNLGRLQFTNKLKVFEVHKRSLLGRDK
jgi:hypothetical protein